MLIWRTYNVISTTFFSNWRKSEVLHVTAEKHLLLTPQQYINWLLTETYTSVHTFGVGDFFFYVFNEDFCSLRLHLFDQIYSEYYEILLQFKIAVFYVNIC